MQGAALRPVTVTILAITGNRNRPYWYDATGPVHSPPLSPILRARIWRGILAGNTTGNRGAMIEHVPATAAIVHLPQWASPSEAAAAHGISERTLRLWAKQGRVQRQGGGRSVLYRLPSRGDAAPVAGMPLAAGDPVPAIAATRTVNSAAEWRDMLDAAIAARVNAERRAAVAEYRAELATVDPDEYAATLEELARVTAERDEAMAAAIRLDAAMRKRFQLIQRLAARVSS